MRYIGSKAHLLDDIDAMLAPHLDGSETSFVDLFAGSNVVADQFKPRYAVTTNDLMYFSEAMAKGSVTQNTVPTFAKLAAIGIADPCKYLETQPLTEADDGFVTREYSPAGPAGRMYFQPFNARRIDFIRTTLDDWRAQKRLDEDEFFYLLNALLQAVPFVSNITGTYGAYLKYWDKRSYKPLSLQPATLIDNHQQNRAYSQDAVALVKRLSGDILYIDTPYNNRQYAPNYHVLETIARNDAPVVHGVTGQRDYRATKSAFAMKKTALAAMRDLVSQLDFAHVVVSYSTDGILSEQELLALLQSVAVDGEVEERRIAYRKYKSKVVNPDDALYELLFYFRPQAGAGRHQPRRAAKPKASKQRVTHGFLKSPLNYIGGKYKLLPQIFPLFPQHADIFVDLFSGGGNVGINANADKVYFNDVNTKINELFRYLQAHDPDELLEAIQRRIQDFALSKTNEAGFLAFRKQYNAHPTPLDLYVLVAYSFNYQFRFNNQFQYNNPFGRNRSHFSPQMAQHLRRFVDRLHQIDATFTDDYFTAFDFAQLTPDSFVYADPPYLITTGSYNDGNRGFGDWGPQQEHELYAVLDALDARGIKFALSNVLVHKGKTNDDLAAWCARYRVHDLQYGYQNASHNTTKGASREVLITNY